MFKEKCKPISSSTSLLSGIATVGGESGKGGLKKMSSKWPKLEVGILVTSVGVVFPPLNPLTIPPRIPGTTVCAKTVKLIKQLFNGGNIRMTNKANQRTSYLFFLLIWRESKGSISSGCKNFIVKTRQMLQITNTE